MIRTIEVHGVAAGVAREVVAGSPVEVLADASEHALAVVVGHRGQGGYTAGRASAPSSTACRTAPAAP
ncbi:hypothetical protein [Streptomyces solicamelliae]|uniref:hypothetical protein n=1 Tax=Streptomyces solicamelliae TaxID=3231716 RepID=UPI0038780D14